MIDCLVDGQPAETIPVDDRGLLYGDHLFETIAVQNGRVPLWNGHWARLERGCRILGLTLPDEQQVLSECLGLSPQDASVVIRLTLTRGSGGRAYFPHEPPKCRRIVQVRAWPPGLEQQQVEGLVLVTSPIRMATGSMLAGLKHGNRLEQVMAARACAQVGADEALVFDVQDQLVEGIMSNVIVELGDRVVTPESGSGVDGVGLAWLRSQPWVDIESDRLDADDVRSANGIMMINSVAGIRPANQVDDRPLGISDRCRAWQQLWKDRIIQCAS
jgi:4-amino-4-deoxychorismate lyase